MSVTASVRGSAARSLAQDRVDADLAFERYQRPRQRGRLVSDACPLGFGTRWWFRWSSGAASFVSGERLLGRASTLPRKGDLAFEPEGRGSWTRGAERDQCVDGAGAGVVVVSSRGGWRRRRFGEDPFGGACVGAGAGSPEARRRGALGVGGAGEDEEHVAEPVEVGDCVGVDLLAASEGDDAPLRAAADGAR